MPHNKSPLLLQDIGEYELIDRLKRLLPSSSPRLRVGIGDDAAVWTPTPGHQLVLTSDTAEEGRHSPPFHDVSPERLHDLGRRAAHMNLSDVAAMAAIPRFALINLSLPKTYPLATIEGFYQGIGDALGEHKVDVVGGNITSTAGPCSVTITLGAEVPSDKAVLRTGSQPGDWVGCTGFPGLSAAGLYVWLHPEIPLSTVHNNILMDGYFRPQARVQEAQSLATYVRAMTDISDGFLLDLANLLVPEDLGVDLYVDKLPHHPAQAALEQHLQKQPHHFMFSASDDYELLFSVSSEQRERWLKQEKMEEAPLVHWVGRVTDQHRAIRLCDQNTSHDLSPEGWQHF
ncbi:MAG: thiamine-phosphate kinase [Deltaproteobacteria bacterium]|nr:MAG: thiamine-phosphate kinase [Deltaproteobacteria bacterium]